MQKVICPNCKKKFEQDRRSSFRPFCSEKCKMIDLGKWLDESYTIPVEDYDDVEGEVDSDEFE